MQYAQTLFYFLGVAGMAGMFCLILMGAETLFWEIFRIIAAGSMAGILIPFILQYVITAGILVILWRIIRHTVKAAKTAATSATDAITTATGWQAVKWKISSGRIERNRKKSMERLLKKEIQAVTENKKNKPSTLQ